MNRFDENHPLYPQYSHAIKNIKAWSEHAKLFRNAMLETEKLRELQISHTHLIANEQERLEVLFSKEIDEPGVTPGKLFTPENIISNRGKHIIIPPSLKKTDELK